MQMNADEKSSQEVVKDSSIMTEESTTTEAFIKQSFEAILHLHEEILAAKEERLLSLRDENAFLKESLYAVQNVYDEDKTTIKLLGEQLNQAQEELEFVKKKYKMMWNQAVENYGRKS